ncbi:MAG: S49 family peptidase [Tepidimonas ignava]|uniref:Protease-4 n=1 Tax=Tepidimonas ignava TaxID=114249 RepID=A0A4R3LI96_9BURK|nr:S49 family peptidase [Tepidimonas ignava]MCX7815576.1 S49 family peptidase [Tepidimonas ignava]TCS97276.1 protease-4 [Tepidimonas ignava]TSE21262.1 putative signal peptide peptidase SppA [Tepidimonas ignava]
MTSPDPTNTTPPHEGAAATVPPSSQPAPGWERALLEKVLLAQLAEQRAARRWRNVWRSVWLALVLLAGWLVYSDTVLPTKPKSTPHTALVEIRGPIGPEDEANASALVGALRAAFEDPGAQAVVLLIDSPGGSPVQAGIVNDEIWRLKNKHDKPVYAVVEETCASAAYYIAAAADRIYVDKASLVGSIGVLMDGFGFTGLMDKLGVERRLLTAGENKGFLDPFSPQTPAHRAHAQRMLDDIHRQFIEVVRKGRGDRLKETPETFSGLVWTGERAVELGLADDFGNVDYVAREVVQAEDIIDYTQRESVAERLARRFGAGAAESLLHLARGAWPAWR